MYQPGANHGFLIRDAAENGYGQQQQLHSRENATNRPQLVLRYAPAPAPETTITGQPADPSGSASATFTFTGSDAGTPQSQLQFECRLGSQAFAACTSPHSYSGLNEGPHTFQVRARNLAGKVDPTPATYSWSIDMTAPETTIDSHPDAKTTSTSATFTFSASEPGSTFECSLDGAAFAACSSPVQYTGLASGAHEFRARAKDRAGNLDAAPAAYSWQIDVPADTTPPETTIDSKPPARTQSTTASFTFSASESGSIYECSLDGAPFAACTSPKEYSGLAFAQHEFRVRAIDAARNVDPTPASYQWTIEAPPADCSTVTTLAADADAWLDQTRPTLNLGSDSLLRVRSRVLSGNYRALVRFPLASAPQGCVLDSATLRLHAASAATGRTLNVLQLASAWTESQVSWANQPQTTGTAAATASGLGYREWNVTQQVQAMYQPGANHGFLIRDAAENGYGQQQQLHSRENATNRPQLVLRFRPAS
jgi:large repetitive protein